MLEERFMQQAIELAVENVHSGHGGPFAALVVKDGKVIAQGTNEVAFSNDPTAHAEIVAIRSACRVLGSFQLTGCDIYASCEPCVMCLGAIYWARPRCVYFGSSAADAAASGFDDSFISDQARLPYGERRIPMIQIMQELALGPFRAWDEKADKVRY